MAVLRKCECPAQFSDCAQLLADVQWYADSDNISTRAQYATARDLALALGVSRPAVTSGVALHAMSDGATLHGSKYTFAAGVER